MKPRKPSVMHTQKLYGPPEMLGAVPEKEQDQPETEPMVQGIVPALEHDEKKPEPETTSIMQQAMPLYGPPEMLNGTRNEANDELTEKMLREPMLQGLVMAPNPDIAPMQMAYGPPPMMSNGGFMGIGMRIPYWLDEEKWICRCSTENTGKFCTECGSSAPAKPAKWLDDSKWRCDCGTENTGKFCCECGAASPAKPAKWLDDSKWRCECGTENVGKFCSECGAAAPAKPAKWLDDSKWRCNCGTENTGKFCCECGMPAPSK